MVSPATEYKNTFRIFCIKVQDCLDLWNDGLLLVKYKSSLENSTSYASWKFYMLQIFGFCMYIIAELNTLQDGDIQYKVHKNIRYRDYINVNIKLKQDSRDGNVLNKCSYAYLFHVPIFKVEYMNRLGKLSNDLKDALLSVKCYLNKDLYKMGKSKISPLKRFGIFVDGPLSMRFSEFGDVEADVYRNEEGVMFVTEDDTVCPFPKMKAGICEYHVGDEPRLKPIIEELERTWEGARVEREMLAEQERKAKEAESVKCQQLIADAKKDKEEKIAAAKKEKAEAASKALAAKKQIQKERELLKKQQIVANGGDQTEFQMNSLKKNQASTKERKKQAEDTVKATRYELKRKQQQGEDELRFTASGYDVIDNSRAVLDPERERVRLANKADKRFISDEDFIENRIYRGSVSPMAFEENTADELKAYDVMNADGFGGGTRDSDEEERSSDEEERGCDEEERGSDEEDRGIDEVESGGDRDDVGNTPGLTNKHLEQYVRGADGNAFYGAVLVDGVMQSSAGSTSNKSGGKTRVVKSARSNKTPSASSPSSPSSGTIVATKKSRKIRDRSMKEDITTAFLNAWTNTEADALETAEADALETATGRSDLAESIDADAELKTASREFKDYLISHVKAEAFNELHFERRVLVFITFVTNSKKVMDASYVHVVNWGKVLAEIGHYIIKEFRDNNKMILDTINRNAPDKDAELRNQADMKAFARVVVFRINCITLSVAQKLIDQWMKLTHKFRDPVYRPLVKRARKADFMALYHKVSVDDQSCQTVRDVDKLKDLEKVVQSSKPDVASLMFLIQPLPENDVYMNILVELVAVQVKGQAVDWDADKDMRALFGKKAITVKAAVPAVPAAPVVSAGPLVPVSTPTSASSPRASGSSASSPVVDVDFPSPQESAETSGASSISKGPPAPPVGLSIEEPTDVLLKRSLKQLLEFLLAGLADSDEHLHVELKNNVYMSDNDESLVLLTGLLEFVRDTEEQTHVASLFDMECCKSIQAQVYIPFKPGDGGNTLGNGYCFYIAGLQLRERAQRDYNMSVEDMVAFAKPLFETPDEHQDLVTNFRSVLATVIESIRKSEPYPDQAVHLLKAESVLNRHTADPYSEVGPEFYGHLEWYNDMPFNVSVFDASQTRSPDLEYWARLAATSILPQKHQNRGSCHTLSQLTTFFEKPLNPCVFTSPHFHIISSPSQDVMKGSFVSIVQELSNRVLDRSRIFDWSAVLNVCEALIGKRTPAANSSSLVGSSIERLFASLRADPRVPSVVLFQAMKPVAATVAASQNADRMKKYKAKIAEMDAKLLELQDTVVKLKRKNSSLKNSAGKANRLLANLPSSPSSPKTSSRFLTGDFAARISDGNTITSPTME